VADDRTSSTITIDAEGRVTLEPGAQKRLAQSPGRFRVVPTTGELVIFQRIPEARREASSSTLIAPGRVVLAGEIDAVGGLVDVINFIHTNSWSGQLSIVDGVVRKTLHFRRGDVRTAASNVAEDRLGAILYRYGMVSEEALAEALKATGGARLGHALVERGTLTPHDLYTYVRKQVEEIFYSVLSLRGGTYYFYRTGDEEGPASQLQLSAKTLLFEGVRRIDELSYFREKLPSGDVVLVRREPQPTERLGPKELRVLTLVDGARTLAEIARASHLGDFETTKILYQLLQSQFVQQRSPSAIEARVRRGDSVEDVFKRVVDTFNFVYAKIYAAVSAKGKQEALARGLESFFGSINEFAPLFVGVQVSVDGTLPRANVLANLEMAPTDNKIDYLHRGLNELLFFELFTAGEAVDRREEIELHQRLNQILRDLPSGGDGGGSGGGGSDDEPEITVEREGGAA
jgi:hypothetical protein